MILRIPILKKNHILEKENDEIKKVEKVNENENENENDNENENGNNENNKDYKEQFMPLENGEIEKEIENKDSDEQKTKINQ